VRELDLPELSIEILWLACVPAATPEPIVATLAAEIRRALEQPALRERLVQLDMTPDLATGDGVTARLVAIRDRYAPTIRATGMTAD
jgi:tripartite-type tricarboxylate transporter receptor subunit TctC